MAVSTGRRVIRVEKSFIGPEKPLTKTVRVKRLTDYPHVSAAHLGAAKRYSSPLLVGPPICDELIAFIQQHLPADVAEQGSMEVERAARRSQCESTFAEILEGTA